jgi:hypothetical protein
MYEGLKILLGGIVADAASRPLHWIYSDKKLKSYIKGKKDIAFFKENKCPFYSVPLGRNSGYGDMAIVMFQTIITSKKKSEILDNFKKNIVRFFGPDSNYWKNLKERKKYKKIQWKRALRGEWLHQNTLETIQNIKAKKRVTGGTKVTETDGFAGAILYYFLVSKEDKEIKKIIRTVANSHKNELYALARLKILDFASEGEKNPIQKFIKLNKKSKYFREVVKDIKKVLKLKNQNHTYVTRVLGKACSDKGNFRSSIHCIITSSNYEQAIIKTIKAGGCNCSRGVFIGSYFAAQKSGNIPLAWIKKTNHAKKILEYL